MPINPFTTFPKFPPPLPDERQRRNPELKSTGWSPPSNRTVLASGITTTCDKPLVAQLANYSATPCSLDRDLQNLCYPTCGPPGPHQKQKGKQRHTCETTSIMVWAASWGGEASGIQFQQKIAGTQHL